jgi:hypothetical protein
LGDEHRNTLTVGYLQWQKTVQRRLIRALTSTLPTPDTTAPFFGRLFLVREGFRMLVLRAREKLADDAVLHADAVCMEKLKSG